MRHIGRVKGVALAEFIVATFIIDCPYCKAKVAAEEAGRAERSYFDDDAGGPEGRRLYVGSCPRAPDTQFESRGL
jgi:hypothetical protein